MTRNIVRDVVQSSALLRRLKEPLRALAASMGYRIVPAGTDDDRFLRSLRDRTDLSLMLDVGANEGQYALAFRREGFAGRIVSFEPLAEPFGRLARRAQLDPRWTVHRVALGDDERCQPMHVARNSVSSSLLTVAPAHLSAAPSSKEARIEEVRVSRLDRFWKSEPRPTGGVWLKIDVQGYEAAVLAGATQALQDVSVVQCELSVVKLYEDQPSYTEVLNLLSRHGFVPVRFLPVFEAPGVGDILQFDVIALRERLTYAASFAQ